MENTMSTKSKKPPVTSPAQPGGSTPSGRPAKDPSGVEYIFPDGRAIAVDDAGAMFAALITMERDPGELTRLLWGLARECDESGKHDGAAAYLEKVLTLEEDPDARARCVLAMGQVFERKGDFPEAVAAYSRAFAEPARENDTWYLLNNNLGYSLNQLGRHGEAEAYCRAAIAIDAGRHNAHKNLGISLQGQGTYVEAARCLLDAARAQPDDSRALDHLEDLLARHEEIARDHPEILEAAQECREAARTSRREPVM
jgi:tetratricopeptide (TPR) repeat protein